MLPVKHPHILTQLQLRRCDGYGYGLDGMPTSAARPQAEDGQFYGSSIQ